MSTEEPASTLGFPSSWKMGEMRLEGQEQDSERAKTRSQAKPEVTAQHLAEQAEIERLSEAAAKIPGRTAWPR